MNRVKIDVPKVRGKIAEKGYNVTSISKKIGVNRGTFSGYLDNPEKMPYGVIAEIANILCDTEEEAISIFFAPDFPGTKVSLDRT